MTHSHRPTQALVQLLEELGIGGDDIARHEGIELAVEIEHAAARFAHEKAAGGDVPGLEAAFPIAVETAGGDEGQIEAGRARAAETAGQALEACDLALETVKIIVLLMRQAAAQERILELAAGGDAQAASLVEHGAAAALGGE